jgi:hypothetical protein
VEEEEGGVKENRNIEKKEKDEAESKWKAQEINGVWKIYVLYV